MLLALVDKLHAQQGPDEWTAALFAMARLARLARELSDWTLAGDLARRMKAHDPAYAGTHYALALVAEHAGDRRTVIAELRDAERLWRLADSDFSDAVDVRARLQHLTR
jgi:hypothetical protein